MIAFRRLLSAFLLFAVLAPSACSEQITVAAAADLNYALQDLAAAFEQKTGDKVVLSFGASGSLFSQIQNGAPFDVFFSADMDYPSKLAAMQLVDPTSLRTYATGHLVLWLSNSLGVSGDQSPASREEIVQMLLRPEVKKVAIANPEHAPYGRAAMKAFDSLGVKRKLAAKLVLGENVSQAAQFAQSGNAQAAVIPLSLAKSASMQASGRYWVLPADTYPPIQQGVAIVSWSKHKKTAQAFVDYVCSAEGIAVLGRYGFGVPSHP